jgi:hypothetical protein
MPIDPNRRRRRIHLGQPGKCGGRGEPNKDIVGLDFCALQRRVECHAKGRGRRQGGTPAQVIGSTVNDDDDCYHVHALFELEKVDRFVYCRIAAATRSLREPKVYT